MEGFKRVKELATTEVAREDPGEATASNRITLAPLKGMDSTEGKGTTQAQCC